MDRPAAATTTPMSTPLYCPFPSSVSPHADAVQRESMAWAQAFGIAVAPAAVAALERSRVGWLVARAVPTAAPIELRLAADWTTFFCLLDDHVERLPPMRVAGLLTRLSSDFAAAGHGAEPLGRALGDLRGRMEACADAAWLEHFARLVDALFVDFILEAIHRASDRCPDLATYRSMREVTVGLHPEFALSELCCGVVLTPEERAHPILVRLTAAAARSVGWANDLFTCVREMGAGEVHNLVVVLVTHHGMTPSQAAAHAAQLHDDEVREVERLAAELANAGLRGEVGRYVECVTSWIRGHMDWARQTGRYGTLAVEAFEIAA